MTQTKIVCHHAKWTTRNAGNAADVTPIKCIEEQEQNRNDMLLTTFKGLSVGYRTTDQMKPRLLRRALHSLAGRPATFNPRTWDPRRSRCIPGPTFQPSKSCSTKTYLLPSWSRMLARTTCRPRISAVCIGHVSINTTAIGPNRRENAGTYSCRSSKDHPEIHPAKGTREIT